MRAILSLTHRRVQEPPQIIVDAPWGLDFGSGLVFDA